MAGNNAASRMIELLDDLCSEPASNGIGVAWAQVFGLEWPDQYAEVSHRLADVLGLPAQIEAEIRAVPDEDHELLLEQMPGLASALSQSQNLNAVLQNICQDITNEMRYGLKMCASVLDRKRRERIIEPSDDAAIRDLLTSLEDEIRQSSDLDAELRLFLLRQVRDMREALDRVAIVGIAALEDSFDRLHGALLRRPDVVQGIQQEPAVGEKFARLLARVVLVLTVTGQLLALPAQVTQMLDAVQGQPPGITSTSVNETPEAP